MRIITISRQFGSGGREIGRKLAEKLGWDFYDKNIITKLCESNNLDEEYVKKMLHDNEWNTSATFANGFSDIDVNSSWQLSIVGKQREVLESIAAIGRDCIIVGRDADLILEEYKPFRIFVCADIQYRLKRCMDRESKNETGRLTEKQVLKNINKIDKKRKRTREILSGKAEDDASTFDLKINSSSWNSAELASALADLAILWFKQKEE